jgi:hypothetical protein
LWIAIAALIAARLAPRASRLLGASYLAICLVSPLVLIYAFCSKCSCKASCAHVLPGKIAGFLRRQPGPYTQAELISTTLALLLLIGTPLAWLWRSPGALVAFLLLNAIAFAQIRLVGCRTCNNHNCPLRIEIPQMEE